MGGYMVAARKEVIQSVEAGKRRLIRDDFTGKIEQVNASLLEMLLAAGYLPVIAPVAVSLRGEALNVDADRAAAVIAAALKADTLVLLTAAPGLMEKFPDESTLVKRVTPAQLPAALEMAQGRMKKKVLGAGEALQGGVGRVISPTDGWKQPITQALAEAAHWFNKFIGRVSCWIIF